MLHCKGKMSTRVKRPWYSLIHSKKGRGENKISLQCSLWLMGVFISHPAASAWEKILHFTSPSERSLSGHQQGQIILCAIKSNIIYLFLVFIMYYNSAFLFSYIIRLIYVFSSGFQASWRPNVCLLAYKTVWGKEDAQKIIFWKNPWKYSRMILKAHLFFNNLTKINLV